MSKFNPLWEYIKSRDESPLKLGFNEIEEIGGLKTDHSFLNFKKELTTYGYKVEKISIKEQTVAFIKI